MATFDTIIKGGTVATTCARFKADVGIRNGKITALGHDHGEARQAIDASGKYVVPRGIEMHYPIAQESATGAMTSDYYFSGSVSAAFGGDTIILPFAAQHRGPT